MTKFMTASEVAAYLRVGRLTVYKMVRTGKLPAFRIGSDYRFSVEEIDRWISGRKVVPIANGNMRQ